MAINIPIAADVSDVLGPVAKMADAYDEVKDNLKDLARAGDDAGDDLAHSMKDGAKAADKLGDDAAKAERKVDKLGTAGKSAGTDLEHGLKEGESAAKSLESKVDAAFDSVTDRARSAGKQVGDSQRAGFREASEGAETFKEEADQNAREVAASFDGSAESIADGFQGLAAEMLSGFGPAGVVAGVAVAAGIGIAISKMQSGAEEATAMKEAVAEIAGAVADAGGRIEDVDFAQIIRDWGREVQEDNWLTFWKDEATTNFEDAADAAKQAGVATKDAIRGMKGSAEDSQGFLDGTQKEWERLQKTIAEGTTVNARGGTVMSESAIKAKDQAEALGELRDAAEENRGTVENAIDVYNIESEVLGEGTEAADAKREAIQELADATNDAADATASNIEAENGYYEAVEATNGVLAENGQNLDVNTEAGRNNRQALVDLAGAGTDYRDAAIAAGEGTEVVTAKVEASRAAFLTAAEAAGMNAGQAAALADSLGLIPADVATQVAAYGTEETKAAIDAASVDTDAAVQVTATGTGETQAEVNSVEGTTAPVEVTTEGTDKAVQGQVTAIKGKDVKIDVDDEYTVRAVQQRIDGIRGKDVYVNVRIANEGAFRAALNGLTAERSTWVTVNERKGTAVN